MLTLELLFFIVGEKPNITHLLQCAFLIAQQIQRGVSICTAFSNAVLDIYCKSRSANEFNTNDTMTIIKTKIADVLGVETQEKQGKDYLDLYDSSVTLRISNFYKYSDIEKIKQQCSILQTYLQVDNETHKTSILYLLIQFYSITSIQDIETRNQFLQHILRRSEYLEVVSKMQIALTSTSQEKICDLPQDFRWLPDAMYSNRNISGSNKTFLAMYLVVRQFSSITEMKAIKKQKGMLLIEYMEDVCAKKIEAKIEDVFVMEALNLFKAYDEFLQNIVRSKDIVINDDQLIESLSCIRWRYILYDIMYVNISKMKSTHLYEMLINLHIHYKWFVEFAVNKLTKMLNISLSDPLNSVLEKIDTALSNKFSAVRKIAEYYQEQIDRPPPLVNNVQLDVVPHFHSIVQKYDIYNKYNNFDTIITVLMAEEEMRFYLVSVKTALDFQFTMVPETLGKLKEIDNKCSKIDSSKICNKYMVHLLPLIDVYIRLIAQKLKAELGIQGYENILKKQVTVPCSLAGVLLRYSETNDGRLKHEIMTEIHQYLMTSAACMPQNFMNFQDNIEDDGVLVLGQFAPLLSILTLKVLMPNEKIMLTQFGNGAEITSQRQIISQLIWKNMQQLSDIRYDQL